MASSTDPLLSADNPYAPPAVRGEFETFELGTPEQIRTEHLSTEVTIRVTGTGIMLLSLVIILIGVVASSRVEKRNHLAATVGWVVAGFLLGNFGKAVHRLRPWTRIPLTILAAPCVLLFPAGTIPGVFILLQLVSRKGKTVLSNEYSGIVQQTPGIKYRPSLLSVLAVIFVLLLGGLVSIVLAAVS